ncbi:MAG: SPOR domain-containing protein [Treponema sp.]|jgi:DedD protein|nr:SPOR domain-containing protein [Treponema sp.]
MEKKKILLVAVSVGIFLVIAIGAAILIFSPRSGAPSNAVVMGRSNPNTYTPPSPMENIPVYPRISDPLTDSQTPAMPDSAYQFPQSPSNAPGAPSASTAIQENNFYINGETRNQPYYSERTETGNAGRTTTPRVVVSVPQPAGARAPLLPETQPAAPKPGGESKPAAAPARPAASASASASAKPAAVAATRQAAPAKTASASAARPAAPSRNTYDAYWVQAGSFSTRIHADGVKETLASKGITSIIENRDLDGKTFYRVRIGPYTSQNEADYWLALIQTLDGFESSQVWKSQAQRLN